MKKWFYEKEGIFIVITWIIILIMALDVFLIYKVMSTEKLNILLKFLILTLVLKIELNFLFLSLYGKNIYESTTMTKADCFVLSLFLGSTGLYKMKNRHKFLAFIWALTNGLFSLGTFVDAIIVLANKPTQEQLNALKEQQVYVGKGKEDKAASILLLIFGFIGLHKFYEKKFLLGFIYILTSGFCGIGLLVDLINYCLSQAKNKKGELILWS